MKYLWNFILSLKEIIIVFFIQYFILILSIIVFSVSRSYYIGTILIMVFDILFIIFNMKRIDISFNDKNNYFPYILLGLSISIIYNMLLYKYGIYSYQDYDISILLIVVASSIVGPIFEEILFRYLFIIKLEKFISNKWVIIFLSSFIFAIAHSNFLSLVIAFFIGIINGYIFIKTRDVIKISLVHIFVNLVSSFLYQYNSYIFIIGICLFIISLLCFWKKK